jgi:hypothetical protein
VPLIAVAALAGGAAAALVARSDDAVAEAKARLGLTNRVVWPFYDAARDRQRTTLELPSTQEAIDGAVEAATGQADDLIDVRIDVPVNQSYVDVVARASNADAARAAANAAADELVVADRQRLIARAESERAGATAALQDLDARIADYQEQLNAVVRDEAAQAAALRVAALNQVEAIERARLSAQVARTGLESSRNAALESRAPLEAEIRRLDIELASIDPEVEVVRYEPPTAQAVGTGALRSGVLTALLVLIVGSAASLVWDHERGLVRDASQLKGDPVLDPIGDLVLPAPSDAATAHLALTLLDRLTRQNSWLVGLVDVDDERTDTSAVMRTLIGQFRRGRYAVAALGRDAAPDGVEQVTLESFARQLHAPTDGQPNGPPAADALFVVWPDDASIEQVAEARDVLTALAAKYAVVLIDCGSRTLSEPARRARLAPCEALLLVARAGATRVSWLRRMAAALVPHQVNLGTVVLHDDRLAGPASGVDGQARRLKPASKVVPAPISSGSAPR